MLLSAVIIPAPSGRRERPVNTRSTVAALLSLALGACAATHEPGWQGNDASAFGTAETLCQGEAADVVGSERDFVFRACMARHGWTPGD